MDNYALITIVIRVLGLAWIAAFLFYHGRKFRRQSKAEFNKAMELISISGIAGFLVFFAVAGLWLWLNNVTPSWEPCLKSGLIGAMVGIGVGELVGMTGNRKQKRRGAGRVHP